ncbi:metallophosphoesterase [Burkholderiaceae bacterium DAT-1]|nr:metallophosphoesterase [Burkholderiaceae bacterium DAT-1]
MSLISSQSGPRVAFVPHNAVGRDFIVGDLHGCRHELFELLGRVGFRPEAGDRLFATGDLIDRGPDSPGCLALLRQPWFFTVIGNHEQMILRALDEGDANMMAMSAANGGSWAVPWIMRKDPVLMRIAAELRTLPNVLVVGPGTRTRFNVVHATLLKTPAEDELFVDRELDEGLKGHDAKAADRMMWSRTLAEEAGNAALRRASPTWQQGLSLTYCGHNPVPYPVILASHCHIDTGSGYEGNVDIVGVDTGVPMRLTIAEHNNGDPIFHDLLVN